MKVPRFLHEAWKKTATEEQLETLREEKMKIVLTRNTTPEHLEAEEKIRLAKAKHNSHKRKYE